MPVITPLVLILATEGLLLLQSPPETLSLREVVAPSHNDVIPQIEPADGIVSTCTIAVDPAVPHPPVTR